MNAAGEDSTDTSIKLEVRRAEKLLQSWCARRNQGAAVATHRLTCLSCGDELRLVNESTVRQNGAVLLRLVYSRGEWMLLLPFRDGHWEVYPHLPRARRIDTVIEELDRAPLHVHWD